MTILRRAPSFALDARGDLVQSGEHLRRDTPHHHLRHICVGSAGLLVSPAAEILWSRGRHPAPRTVLVVEGLTDFLAARDVRPNAAVIGVPGSLSASQSATIAGWRRRPRRVQICAQSDAAGIAHAARVATAFLLAGLVPSQVVVIVAPTIGGEKDVADCVRRGATAFLPVPHEF